MVKFDFGHRDAEDPRYKSWRFAIFALCGWTCILCKNKGGKLEAHHIVRWADNEKLRFAVSNGCCLCQDCHQLVTGREKDYEYQFKRLIKDKLKARNIKITKRRRKKYAKKLSETRKTAKSIQNTYKRKLRNPRARY